MADRFEDVIHHRISALETRVDDEARSVKEHFDELRQFITESLNAQAVRLRDELRAEWRAEFAQLRDELRTEWRTGLAELRAELRAEFRAELRAEIGRLEHRLEVLRLDFTRLEQKMDTRFDAVQLILQDIVRRLPPPAAA